MSRDLESPLVDAVRVVPDAAANIWRLAADRTARSMYAGDALALFLGAVRIADCAVIVAAAVLAYRVREASYDLGYAHWLQIAIGCVVAASALGSMDIYNLASLRDRSSQLGRAFAAWTVAILAVTATIYFTKTSDEFSRAWVLLWGAAGYIGLIGVRVAAWASLALLRHRGLLVLNVAVVGNGQSASELARRIEKSAQGDVRVIGVFQPKAADHGLAENAIAASDIGGLLRLAQQIRIDEIAVSLPCVDAADISASLRKLCVAPVDVTLYPDIVHPQISEIAGARAPSAVLLRRPLAGWRMVVKRSMDITLSAIAALILAPLMVVIAVLVKLDSPGPILFRQQRFGFSNQPISIIKFRTMRKEAALDPLVPQARRWDPRVTRVGRFLRRASLDELPQLFNVLGGSMSLVGPRPHAIAHHEQYARIIDGYLGRSRVRPGITGWAQVNGLRGETNTIEKMERRIKYDLYYIEHWSPFFDIYILVITLFVGFHHRNAY